VDKVRAENLVRTYLDSNSTLRTMPLSHSLAYMRQLLSRHGFNDHITSGSKSSSVTKGAMLVTMIGAASFMTGQAEIDYAAMQQMLFGLGVAGSIVQAGVKARKKAKARQNISQEEPRNPTRIKSMKEAAEQVAKMINSLNMRASLSEMLSLMKTKLEGALRQPDDTGAISVRREQEPTLMSPNPYEHIGFETKLDRIDEKRQVKQRRKIPSGCVGAYCRVLEQAETVLRERVKKERRERFEALSDEEQRNVGMILVDACMSNDNLETVRTLIQQQGNINVDAFFMGPDGNKSCALHSAALHGASRVLEFLCGRVHETDPSKDGGLCDVNVRDDNGWTAMHYAAGANSSEAIRILASHGGNLFIEAGNGYTPYHWAQRLSNTEAIEELEKLGADVRFWSFSGQRHQHPLSFLSNRFFSTVPTT